jgi:hypothetical protein
LSKALVDISQDNKIESEEFTKRWLEHSTLPRLIVKCRYNGSSSKNQVEVTVTQDVDTERGEQYWKGDLVIRIMEREKDDSKGGGSAAGGEKKEEREKRPKGKDNPITVDAARVTVRNILCRTAKKRGGSKVRKKKGDTRVVCGV